MSLLATDVALSFARRWPRQLWLLAVPLALVWFGFWGLLWSPEAYTPQRHLPRFAPHARFLPGRTAAVGDEAQRDLRVMWSPVLFALPTPMGFSRTPAAGDGHDRPRVQRPGLEPVLLSPPQDADRGRVVSTISVPAFTAGDRFNVDEGVPVFTTQPAITNMLLVELLGELAALQPLGKPLPVVPAGLAADSWSMKVQIDIGREGSVRHAFLDPPSAAPEFNIQVLQAISRWRFAPLSAERQGSVRLYYAATPRPASSVPEAAQP